MYLLDADGLKQLNVDDLAGEEDAFSNLYHDAPMTNVVSLDGRFSLSQSSFALTRPCVLLVATDGCFGYLKSPMEFEFLLLDELEASESIDEWQDRLERGIDEVAGDDQTLLALVYGYSRFESLQSSLRGRWRFMQNMLGSMPDDFEARIALWKDYKDGYYSANALGGATLS